MVFCFCEFANLQLNQINDNMRVSIEGLMTHFQLKYDTFVGHKIQLGYRHNLSVDKTLKILQNAFKMYILTLTVLMCADNGIVSKN